MRELVFKYKLEITKQNIDALGITFADTLLLMKNFGVDEKYLYKCQDFYNKNLLLPLISKENESDNDFALSLFFKAGDYIKSDLNTWGLSMDWQKYQIMSCSEAIDNLIKLNIKLNFKGKI